MENPLSQDQIKKISEIAKLPVEQQQSAWDQFVRTLSKEQIEFLRSQQQASQTSQCVFCSLVEGKLPAKKVYEDDHILVVLDIKPANKGHAVVVPKQHFPVSALMPENEIGHMFNVANDVAKHVFESVNAEGTNVLLSNGVVAGQMGQHVVVHVIPRFKDDKVNINWEGVQLSEEEMNQIAEDLSSRMGGKIKQHLTESVQVAEEVKPQKRVEQQPEGEENLKEYNLDDERIP